MRDAEESAEEVRGPGPRELGGQLRPLALAALVGGFGYLLLGASFATFWYGGARENRPHEVTGEELFFALLAVHALLAGVILFLLLRAARRRLALASKLSTVLAVLCAGVYALIVLAFLGMIGWGLAS